MSNKRLFRVIDFFVFFIVIILSVCMLMNKTLILRLDRSIIPEKRNEGYYEILNVGKERYIDGEVLETGSQNLLANYMKSGEREAGYSITVFSDGRFSFSGSNNEEKNKYEYPIPKSNGFDLPTGDYVLSDGGASSEEGISLRIVGVKHQLGGEAKYMTVASLPGKGKFHWDRDPDIELIVDLVIRPEASAENLVFSPMLINVESLENHETNVDYQPIWVPNYEWQKEDDELSDTIDDDGKEEGTAFLKYDILKGALDDELITKDDWEAFSNSIRFRMQGEYAILDFKDGTGIVVREKEFPMGIYGNLSASKLVSKGVEVKIDDYQSVRDCFDEFEEPKLRDIEDFYEYLKVLRETNYTVLISIRDDGVNSLNKKQMNLLGELGVKANLVAQEKEKTNKKLYYRNSYLSVLTQGEAREEKIGEDILTTTGKLSDGKEYSIESVGRKAGDPRASICIDGIEYAMNLKGMNMVIYDEEDHKVIDSVCFDTNSGLWCHRQPQIIEE